MKNDVKKLIQEKEYSAVLITGPARHNPSLVYFTGCRNITNADLIISNNGDSVLFYNPIEREEAAVTGLTTRSFADYKWNELLKEANGDPGVAVALRYKKMLTDLKITSGRIAVYGQVDAGSSFNLLSRLQEIMPDIEIVGESAKNSILLEAMSTKDSSEVERIREMGRITTSVVGEVADFLTSQKVKNGIVIDANGDPLTIGEVKKRINLMLIKNGVENPHGTIFAIGRDAGIPHSSGNPQDIIELGKTIVFDIFPCEEGGGYHYDFTRTWCLGFAPDNVLAIYEDVKDVYLQIMEELVVNEPFGDVQKLTCELFESKGHSTINSDPTTQEGYVHSIGHGVGLHIHEAPWSGLGASEKDVLAPGIVATIEPGLYYPSKEMGCRIENTFTVTSNGKIDILAEFPLNLVLPMK